jgi:hypothetical protein
MSLAGLLAAALLVAFSGAILTALLVGEQSSRNCFGKLCGSTTKPRALARNGTLVLVALLVGVILVQAATIISLARRNRRQPPPFRSIEGSTPAGMHLALPIGSPAPNLAAPKGPPRPLDRLLAGNGQEAASVSVAHGCGHWDELADEVAAGAGAPGRRVAILAARLLYGGPVPAGAVGERR